MKLFQNISRSIHRYQNFILLHIPKLNKSTVTIVEVGPRDGLQSESVILPWTVKVELIDKLSKTGISRIECGSFVKPELIPQLSDAKEVFANINNNKKVRYSALVPNVKGLNSALKCNVKEIAIFGAASEKFNQKNINCSIEDSFIRFKEVIDLAKLNNIPVRGYLSCVAYCPYQGKTDPKFVGELTNRLLEMGCFEVSLGDTIGQGIPNDIANLMDEVLKTCDKSKIALHCHDTNGRALENINCAMDMGIAVFDSSIAGLGGCPFAGPLAKGNVATERLIEFLAEKGRLSDAIDRDEIRKVAIWIASVIREKKFSQKVAEN